MPTDRIAPSIGLPSECNCPAAQQGFVAVALRYEHYFPLNMAFLRELLRGRRLAELECPDDGDTEIAYADCLGQSCEHSRIWLYAEGLDANILSFCCFGFSQDRAQDSSALQLRNQLTDDLTIDRVGDCIQIRKGADLGVRVDCDDSLGPQRLSLYLLPFAYSCYYTCTALDGDMHRSPPNPSERSGYQDSLAAAWPDVLDQRRPRGGHKR